MFYCVYILHFYINNDFYRPSYNYIDKRETITVSSSYIVTSDDWGCERNFQTKHRATVTERSVVNVIASLIQMFGVEIE